MLSTEVPRRGHPDKLADGIADYLLSEILYQNPETRAAIEVLITGTRVIVAGEVSLIDSGVGRLVEDVVEHYCATVKYVPGVAFIPRRVDVSLQPQTDDCAQTVLRGLSGDQSIVVGYAQASTSTRLPLGHHLARKVQRFLDDVSTCEQYSMLSDGKLLLSMPGAGRTRRAVRCELNVQLDYHAKGVRESLEQAVSSLIASELEKVVEQVDLELESEILLNPGGRFSLGGPMGDTGLTGRKIVSDLYGCEVRTGGGALSGKDFTKVDRSGAYLAREWAVAVVNAGLAQTCEVQLCFGRSSDGPLDAEIRGLPEHVVEPAIALLMDSTVTSLSELVCRYGAASPKLTELAAYGHVGRDDSSLAWENPDRELVRELATLC